MARVNKPYKQSRGDKAILAILRAFKKKKTTAKSYESIRTKSTSDRLREAGISEKKINKFKDKPARSKSAPKTNATLDEYFTRALVIKRRKNKSK